MLPQVSKPKPFQVPVNGRSKENSNPQSDLGIRILNNLKTCVIWINSPWGNLSLRSFWSCLALSSPLWQQTRKQQNCERLTSENEEKWTSRRMSGKRKIYKDKRNSTPDQRSGWTWHGWDPCRWCPPCCCLGQLGSEVDKLMDQTSNWQTQPGLSNLQLKYALHSFISYLRKNQVLLFMVMIIIMSIMGTGCRGDNSHFLT